MSNEPFVRSRAWLKSDVASLLVSERYIYWRELDRGPQTIKRLPFEAVDQTEITPPGLWTLDMRLSGDTVLYTASPSGDPDKSDSRVVRLDPDGTSAIIADHQWQAAQPTLVGNDVYWVTGLNDLVLATAAVPQRARIHRRSANGTVTTFEQIKAFGNYLVLPEGILTISMLRQKVTLYPFDGSPSRELFAGENLEGPVVDERGAIYVASAPRLATSRDRIVRIFGGKVEDYVTGATGYDYLQFVDGVLYFTQKDGLMRKTPDGPVEEVLKAGNLRMMTASRKAIAWFTGSRRDNSWTIKTIDLTAPVH